VIFRRKSSDPSEPPRDDDDEFGPEASDELEEIDRLEDDRRRGPWDRDETTVDEADDSYIDLGGLIVKGTEGLELRLQVVDQEGNLAGVMLAGPDSGLELRAFAAPRSGGVWDGVREDIAAEAVRMGGTASEVDGEFGTELVLSVPVATPDGRQATQLSRVVGVEGPRWLLRGTFLGKSVQEPDPQGPLESAFRSVIVVRGEEPMAPREMIPMRMPAAAQAQLMGEQQEQQPDDPTEQL
jgi:hypothetical protein